LDPARHYYAYVVLGSADINGTAVTEGDGLAIESETFLEITRPTELEIILFDLR